jgi:hypothetical protein
MRRLLPTHLRPLAVLIGVLLSAVVMLSDSPAAVDTSLVLLALALLAFELPTRLKDVEDDL